ncbi:MAG: DUF6429 family protein [Elusimicrobiota bacterium]|jgi:hypothetical protein|nr:DUF6429 family protein [Elusimicrobiota bacterium]
MENIPIAVVGKIMILTHDATDSLKEKEFIDGKNRDKSISFTEKGEQKALELLKKYKIDIK